MQHYCNMIIIIVLIVMHLRIISGSDDSDTSSELVIDSIKSYSGKKKNNKINDGQDEDNEDCCAGSFYPKSRQEFLWYVLFTMIILAILALVYMYYNMIFKELIKDENKEETKIEKKEKQKKKEEKQKKETRKEKKNPGGFHMYGLVKAKERFKNRRRKLIKKGAEFMVVDIHANTIQVENRYRELFIIDIKYFHKLQKVNTEIYKDDIFQVQQKFKVTNKKDRFYDEFLRDDILLVRRVILEQAVGKSSRSRLTSRSRVDNVVGICVNTIKREWRKDKYIPSKYFYHLKYKSILGQYKKDLEYMRHDASMTDETTFNPKKEKNVSSEYLPVYNKKVNLKPIRKKPFRIPPFKTPPRPPRIPSHLFRKSETANELMRTNAVTTHSCKPQLNDKLQVVEPIFTRSRENNVKMCKGDILIVTDVQYDKNKNDVNSGGHIRVNTVTKIWDKGLRITRKDFDKLKILEVAPKENNFGRASLFGQVNTSLLQEIQLLDNSMSGRYASVLQERNNDLNNNIDETQWKILQKQSFQNTSDNRFSESSKRMQKCKKKIPFRNKNSNDFITIQEVHENENEKDINSSVNTSDIMEVTEIIDDIQDNFDDLEKKIKNFRQNAVPEIIPFEVGDEVFVQINPHEPLVKATISNMQDLTNIFVILMNDGKEEEVGNFDVFDIMKVYQKRS